MFCFASKRNKQNKTFFRNFDSLIFTSVSLRSEMRWYPLCQCNGVSYWWVGILSCWCFDMSAYGCVGVLMCQHIVVSVFWYVSILLCLCIDMSAYGRVGVLICRQIVTLVFWYVSILSYHVLMFQCIVVSVYWFVGRLPCRCFDLSADCRVGVLICQNIAVSCIDVSVYCRIGVLICWQIALSVVRMQVEVASFEATSVCLYFNWLRWTLTVMVRPFRRYLYDWYWSLCFVSGTVTRTSGGGLNWYNWWPVELQA